MSVINQVLLDLEKRRASPAERGAVPNHVRALPDGGGTSHWMWIAGAAAAALATAAAAAWMVMGGAAPASAPVAQRSGTEAAIEQVVTASAGVTPAVERAGAPAFQLSFELSRLPVEEASGQVEKTPSSAPLSSARVVGRPAGEPANEHAPSPRKEKAPVVAAAKPDAAGASTQPEIKKQVRQLSVLEQAESEYRKAVALLHQGRLAEAQEGFEAALRLHPAYQGARQALVGLMVEGRRLAEAERILQEGLALAPSQIGFAMTLARLQIDRGETGTAIATLRKGLDYAQGSPDYIAFLAALLQRQGRHDEAIEQFQAALRQRPAAGVWWLGLGISLQAANRSAEAQDAYRRARTSNNLTPELAAFADQRIKQLQ